MAGHGAPKNLKPQMMRLIFPCDATPFRQEWRGHGFEAMTHYKPVYLRFHPFQNEICEHGVIGQDTRSVCDGETCTGVRGAKRVDQWTTLELMFAKASFWFTQDAICAGQLSKDITCDLVDQKVEHVPAGTCRARSNASDGSGAKGRGDAYTSSPGPGGSPARRASWSASTGSRSGRP